MRGLGLAGTRVPLAGMAALLLGLLFDSPAAAQTIFTMEHADVNVRFENGQLELFFLDEDNEIDSDLSDVFVFGGPNTLRVRPADPRFLFIGVDAGQPVWILPQTRLPEIIWIGFGSEEVPEGALLDDEVTISLISVLGPAGSQFSVWQTDPFGNPTVFMATFDGISANDRVVLGAEDEDHFNWGFTAPGIYEIAFQVSGRLLDGTPIQSEVATLTVGIQSLPAVIPEPASLGLFTIGGVGLWFAHVRRRRLARVRR